MENNVQVQKTADISSLVGVVIVSLSALTAYNLGEKFNHYILFDATIFIISLVIILPIRYFIIQPFYVKGASMEPNFHDHEYLIIDEISRLQHKNQTLLRDYINSNGFKTLFITPDALYPDLDKAIYYIFKNIENEGESLRVTQMNKKHQ